MDSAQEEQQNLMKNLQQVQEKFLNEWSESFIQLKDEKKESFKESMAEGKGRPWTPMSTDLQYIHPGSLAPCYPLWTHSILF